MKDYKLIRDKIGTRIYKGEIGKMYEDCLLGRDWGFNYEIKMKYLKRKLKEEAEEAIDVVDNGDLLMELVDLFEVIRHISEMLDVNMDDIKVLADIKLLSHGGFEYGWFYKKLEGTEK